MDEKRFRLDFVIAFCALLISTVAALASVYQTRVIGSSSAQRSGRTYRSRHHLAVVV